MAGHDCDGGTIPPNVSKILRDKILWRINPPPALAGGIAERIRLVDVLYPT